MGLHRPAAVEATAEVLQGDDGGQLHDLRVGVVLLQLAEQLVGNPLRGISHGLGKLQGDLLCVRKQVAPAEVQQGQNPVVGSTFLASTASIGVHSERTTDL